MENINHKPACYQNKELACAFVDFTNCIHCIRCFKVRDLELYKECLDKALKFVSGVHNLAP